MTTFVRIMILLGLLSLVPALIVLWRSSKAQQPSFGTIGDEKDMSRRSVGKSVLSHGGPQPASTDSGPRTAVETDPTRRAVNRGEASQAEGAR